jgi:hypothetical protein
VSEASFKLVRDALQGCDCWPKGDHPNLNAKCPVCREPALFVDDFDDAVQLGCRQCRASQTAILYALNIDPEFELAALELSDENWLAGQPMDIRAEIPARLAPLAGYPFACRGQGVIISGPTGGGRSSLVQACAYDGALEGVRTVYLGHEISQEEFNARGARLAALRGHEDDDEIVDVLCRNVRYLPLMETIRSGDGARERWAEDMSHAYDVVIFDPMSAIASALGLNFDSNEEYARFYDRLVQPLTARGVAVVKLDNVGHGPDSAQRPKGASAKLDRADLVLSCSSHREGLLITARKVRSIRIPFSTDDQWLFRRDTQTVERFQAVDHAAEDPAAPSLLQTVSEYIEAHPGAKASEITRGVHGNGQAISNAIRQLDGSYIRVQQDGKARRHFPVRAYVSAPPSPAIDSGSIPALDRTSTAVNDSVLEPDDSGADTGLGIDSEPIPTPSADRTESERFFDSPSFKGRESESIVSAMALHGRNTDDEDMPF